MRKRLTNKSGEVQELRVDELLNKEGNIEYGVFLSFLKYLGTSSDNTKQVKELSVEIKKLSRGD